MKTEENFNLWNEWKQWIEQRWEQNTSNWEFWIYYEWINIWRELSKWQPFTRPCIVVNNDLWKNMILIIPISSKMDRYNQDKKDYFIEVEDSIKYGLDTDSFFAMNHMKIISTKRLNFRLSWKRKDLWNIKIPKYPKEYTWQLREFIKNRIIEYNYNY